MGQPIQKLLLQYKMNKNFKTTGYIDLNWVKHGVNAVLIDDK
jgi:hypothetical protein